jgi:GNAT superfamily N-acetyltransferase
VTITYRRGTSADADECAAVHLAAAVVAYRDIFPPEADPPKVADLAPGWATAAWVAEAAGHVVGGVCVAPDADVPSGWLLSRLYVHPDYQGRGIGGQLLDLAVASAADDGAAAINLWVLEPNTKARVIYERRGWRMVPGATLPNDGTDAVDVLYQLEVEVVSAR